MIQLIRYGLWAAVAAAFVVPTGALHLGAGGASDSTQIKTVSRGVSGQYMEARTCQVYTGPCFANGEMGIAGKEAIMAWSIQDGGFGGVELAGLKVVAVLRATDTLGFEGIEGAGDVKSLIIVDNRANSQQRKALVEFAKKQTGQSADEIVRVDESSIDMGFDVSTLEGRLAAGDDVFLTTRKVTPEDCICHNEIAFYPPLAQTSLAQAGVTTDGGFSGRGLGARWSIPDTRSAYMAMFEY